MAKNYFYQHTSGYIFRYCVPQDVQNILGQREFRYSLRTGSLRVARQRADLLIMKLKSFIMEIRGGIIHNIKIIKYELGAITASFTDVHSSILTTPSLNLHNHPTYSPQQQPETTIAFSDLVERYIEENQTWRGKTKHENQAIYALFIRVMDDMPLSRITRMVVSDYKRILLKLPPCLNLNKRYRNMPIRKVLKENHQRTISPTTVNKHLVRLSTIFKYAVHNGLMQNNPATEMQIKTNKRDDELRAAYSKDDLNKLFKSENYLNDSHQHSYQFWVPILGLYSGARLEEICQLHLYDIRKEDGVWVMDINDDGEKRIKTKSSKRLIPLHPFLVDDLGIVKYAQQLGEKGHKRFFPELARRRDGYGQTVSKWFNERYKKKCGITPPPNGAKLDFHSFRHTFVNELKQLQVNPDMIRELDGHKKGDMTMDRYGKAFKPSILLTEAISKLDYNFEHLSDSMWVTDYENGRYGI